MKKQSGRTHKTTGVSMSPDLKEQVEERARALYPKVSNVSNYIVQLIKLDMEQGLVGPIQQKKKGKNGPFEHPLAPYMSNTIDGLVPA